MNTIQNTFRTPPAAVVRRENSPRIHTSVRVGQIYQNDHGHWKVGYVSGGLADLLPVFSDGSKRPALSMRVESIANLNGPFYRLCPVVKPERGNVDAVAWALIGIAVMVLGLVAYGILTWRVGV